MPFFEALRLALAQIRVQKLKSFFTLLGVVIGVMFLIAVVSVVEGMSRYLTEDFAARILGVNTFTLRRIADVNVGEVTEEQWRQWMRRPLLYPPEVEQVRAVLPSGVRTAVETDAFLMAASPWNRPRRVLAIGLGGGFTLRALIHHDAPREITAVEIDPLVVEAARREFAPFNDHALDDPRVRVVTNDGRNFVDGADGFFDVITSEPPNIWVAGVSGLFTQEFYRSAAARLSAGGILCQWIPLYEMEREDFRIMLNTLTSVFPQVTFWQVGADVMLLASKEPFRIERQDMAAKLRHPALARDFTAIGLTMRGVIEFLNSPAVRPDQVPAFLGRIDILNVDDRPVLEFSTARNLFELAKQAGEGPKAGP